MRRGRCRARDRFLGTCGRLRWQGKHLGNEDGETEQEWILFGTIFKAWTQVGTAVSVIKIGNKVTPYLLSERQIRLKQSSMEAHQRRCSPL